MKIAFFAWESLHTIAVGAVATHVTELAAALERRGHEVHVFARIGEGQRLYDVVDGVHYHRCPIALDPDFVTEMGNMGRSLFQQLVETEGFHGSPFDVVHGHDWLCAKGLVHAKNERGRKVVLTYHSTELGRAGNRGPHSSRIAAMEAEGAYVADRIITSSAALADEVCWLYHAPADKVRTIRNGIHCGWYDRQVDAGEVRASMSIGPLDPTVLFAGRLCWDDGPDLLLDAMPGVIEFRPDAKLVVVGDGEMRGFLGQRASELGIAGSVRFLGDVPEIAPLLQSVDAVCVPSRRESFGPRVLEAWAARKPVVVTYKLDVQDFVHHGVDGMVVYDNAPSICWGINSIFGDFEKARQMGDRGRVKAAYGYSWDVISGQVEGVYRELV
ncbi:MAG TPA: glycosyltransferase family 4 protein [Polyangiaceae bacterium]